MTKFIDEFEGVDHKKSVSFLDTEFDGREDSLLTEIGHLNDRSDVNLGLNGMNMKKMRTLQIVSNAIRFTYILLLFVMLVLFAYERWPEYYEDKDWWGALTFILTGTFLVIIPYYILDIIMYVYKLFGGYSDLV